MAERDTLVAVAGYYRDWGGIKGKTTAASGRLIASRMKGRRGLEMGWGPGVMHEALEQGIEVMDVVEGDVMLARQAQEEIRASGATAFTAMFEEFAPGPIYDEIVMASVLEHVVDPALVLRRARTWLAEGGRIHVIVPNGHSVHRLLGSLAGMIERPDEVTERDRMVEHRRVYTWASLRAEVEAAGLEVTHMEGILLKPFPWSGMNLLTEAAVDRLFELAPCCPELCAEVYLECQDRNRTFS